MGAIKSSVSLTASVVAWEGILSRYNRVWIWILPFFTRFFELSGFADHTQGQRLFSEGGHLTTNLYTVEGIPLLIVDVPSFGLLARENERNVFGRR